MSEQKYDHVRWIDLAGNGIGKEVLVVSEDKSNGDLYFIPVEHLDEIDKMRVISMLRSRDAKNYPLWEVMANTTLKNGMNALVMFHQLVKVRTAQGHILAPGKGRGIRPQSITEQLGGVAPTEPGVQPAQEQKRGPGRPPKADPAA